MRNANGYQNVYILNTIQNLHFDVKLLYNFYKLFEYNNCLQTLIYASHWNYCGRIWFILYRNEGTTVEAIKTSKNNNNNIHLFYVTYLTAGNKSKPSFREASVRLKISFGILSISSCIQNMLQNQCNLVEKQ